jgi:hypothetical protein
MFAELRIAMDNTHDLMGKDELRKILVDENLLKKESYDGRKRTYSHLLGLYGLDANNKNYQGLLKYWDKDASDLNILAMLCALSRDEALRISANYILSLSNGEIVDRSGLKHIIDENFGEKYSEKVRQSMLRNVLSSWTQSGHLKGKSKRIRDKPIVTPNSFAYACYLAYLAGFRGNRVFHSPWVKVLCLSDNEFDIIIRDINRKGLMTLKRAGDIVEVSFPEELVDGVE